MSEKRNPQQLSAKVRVHLNSGVLEGIEGAPKQTAGSPAMLCWAYHATRRSIETLRQDQTSLDGHDCPDCERVLMKYPILRFRIVEKRKKAEAT